MKIRVEKVVISKNIDDHQFIMVDIHTKEEWPKIINLELRGDCNNMDNIIQLFTLRHIKKLRSFAELDFNTRSSEDRICITDGDDTSFEFTGFIGEVN